MWLSNLLFIQINVSFTVLIFNYIYISEPHHAIHSKIPCEEPSRTVWKISSRHLWRRWESKDKVRLSSLHLYCIMFILLLLLILFSMVLISRSKDLWKILLCSIDKLSSPSSSIFSFQYLLLFLKSSRSCSHLLPTPFTSVICPSMASWRK